MEKIYKLVIVGRPNDGKSSIFANFLGDDEVAVSPIPGETKRLQPREINMQKYRIEIIDTPGLQHPETVYLKFKEYANCGRKPAAAFAEDFTEPRYSHDVEIMKALSDADICMLVVNADNFFGHTQKYLLETFSMLGSATPLIAVINRKTENFADEWRKEFELRGIDCFDFDAFKSKFKDCARLFDEICASESLRRRTELREVLSMLKDNRTALWDSNFDAAAAEILNSLIDLMQLSSYKRMQGFSLNSDERIKLKRDLVSKLQVFICKFRTNILKQFKYTGVKIKAPEMVFKDDDLYLRNPNIFSRALGGLPFVRRPLAYCKVDYRSDAPLRFVQDAISFVLAISTVSYAQSASKDLELDLEKKSTKTIGADYEKFERFAARAAREDDSDSFFEMQSELRTVLRDLLAKAAK